MVGCGLALWKMAALSTGTHCTSRDGANASCDATAFRYQLNAAALSYVR